MHKSCCITEFIRTFVAQKLGCGPGQPNLKNFVFRLSLRSPFTIFAA